MRRITKAAIVVTMAVLPLTAAPLVAVPSASATEPIDYVALGDSYSAASGVLPVDASSPLCLRSTRNYPHVVADATGAELTDVTCGAAKTSHFTSGQYPGVAPQLDALSADTDVVTMTIGGNDSNTFISAVLACGTLGSASLGHGSPCADTFGSRFTDTINNSTYPALVDALTAVKNEAPHADIAILGYPWIMPADGGCFPRMPVARGDVGYIRDLQATLNDAVERAAAATGVTFVDLSEVSEGHDACQPLGTRWIEPALLGTNPVIVHPNALGERGMAAAAMAALEFG